MTLTVFVPLHCKQVDRDAPYTNHRDAPGDYVWPSIWILRRGFVINGYSVGKLISVENGQTGERFVLCGSIELAENRFKKPLDTMAEKR